MKISFSQKGKASQHDINNLEKSIGAKLPSSFVNFIHKNNGAAVSPNSFLVSGVGDNGIQEFIPVGEIMAAKQAVEGLSQSLLPFAYAEGGDIVAFHLQDNFGIYYWSHENLLPAIKISIDFSNFMDNLIPEDSLSSEYTLQEGEEVWVDPEFEKMFPPQFTVKTQSK